MGLFSGLVFGFILGVVFMMYWCRDESFREKLEKYLS